MGNWADVGDCHCFFWRVSDDDASNVFGTLNLSIFIEPSFLELRTFILPKRVYKIGVVKSNDC